MAIARVLNLGYEGRSINELIDILLSNRVMKLLDIRELPFSRRREFTKKALASSLEEAGIEYIHLRPAGNPYRKEKNDIKRCLQLYETYLVQKPEVVELVADQISETDVAFLCYERHHDDCHRSVLLNTLHQRGYSFEVVRAE